MRASAFFLIFVLSLSISQAFVIKGNYIEQTRYTEPSPEMITLAQQFKGETPAKTINNVERWVLNNSNIKYDWYARFGVKASEWFKLKKADCRGQALIIISLLRENGIQSRYVIGPAHAWAEARIGSAWVGINDLGLKKMREYRWI